MLTTQEVVNFLDEHVIGQEQAKHAIAIASRERFLKVQNSQKDARWKVVVPSNILMVGTSGVGKAQPLSRRIKVPGGWSTMGDMEYGTVLSMPDGTAATVCGVYPQGLQTTAEVTFADGRSTRACINHLWEVTLSGVNSPQARILTTGQMVEMMQKDTQGNLKLSVRLIANQDMDPDVELPLDPYLLGVLLGDGGLTKHHITLTNPDDHIVNKVNNILIGYDSVLSVNEKRPMEHWIKKIQRDNTKSDVISILNNMGLMGENSWGKFIPEIYLHASRNQRLALVQGLMDTDGYAGEQGAMEYCTTSVKLAKSMMYLIRSLGGICKMREKEPKFNYKGEVRNGHTAYVLGVRHKRPTELFTLPKKRDRVRDDHQYSENMRLRVKSISNYKKELCQCILVNHPDHLYITDDFIVTHNTELARALAKMANAPMVKEEVTAFTQVGYYGRDVSTIMSDLLKEAIRIAPKIWAEEQKEQSSSFSNKEMDKLKPVYYAETALFANHLKVDPEKFTWDHFVTAYTSGKLNKLNVLYKYRIDLLTAEHDKGNKKTLDSLDDSDDVTDETKDIIQSMGIDFGNFFAGGKSINIYIREMVEMLSPVDVKQPKHVEVLSKTFDNKTLNKILTRISNNAVGRRRLTAFFTGMAPDQLKAWCDKLAMSFTISVASLLKAKTKLPGRSGSDVPKEFIIKLIEERGIIFIDEFDKIFLDKDGGNVGNIGVVRDLMPYLDGITVDVSTKGERETGGFFGGNNETYRINTANILFIVAGAFQLAKVEDVPAEILGRLPVHVKLKSLTVDDLVKVIKKPYGSELTRMQLMMDAEGVDFQIDDDAIKAIAELVFACNRKGEDLGARRVIGVMHVLFDRYKFDASNGKDVQVVVTRKYIESMSPTVLADVIDRPDVNDKPQTVTLELPKQLIKPQPKPKSKPE